MSKVTIQLDKTLDPHAWVVKRERAASIETLRTYEQSAMGLRCAVEFALAYAKSTKCAVEVLP